MAATPTRIIPSLRYRDAAAAAEWLCRAFGFEKHVWTFGTYDPWAAG